MYVDNLLIIERRIYKNQSLLLVILFNYLQVSAS